MPDDDDVYWHGRPVAPQPRRARDGDDTIIILVFLMLGLSVGAGLAAWVAS